MKRSNAIALLWLATLVLPAAAGADEIVPVTSDSDGLAQFEQNLIQSHQKGAAGARNTGARRQNARIGAMISHEARILQVRGVHPQVRQPQLAGIPAGQAQFNSMGAAVAPGAGSPVSAGNPMVSGGASIPTIVVGHGSGNGNGQGNGKHGSGD